MKMMSDTNHADGGALKERFPRSRRLIAVLFRSAQAQISIADIRRLLKVLEPSCLLKRSFKIGIYPLMV